MGELATRGQEASRARPDRMRRLRSDRRLPSAKNAVDFHGRHRVGKVVIVRHHVNNEGRYFPSGENRSAASRNTNPFAGCHIQDLARIFMVIPLDGPNSRLSQQPRFKTSRRFRHGIHLHLLREIVVSPQWKRHLNREPRLSFLRVCIDGRNGLRRAGQTAKDNLRSFHLRQNEILPVLRKQIAENDRRRCGHRPDEEIRQNT